MDGSEFIAFAARIAAQQSGSAGYRSAVSRAYCGCFHLTRAVLHQFGWRCRSRENEHAWVQRHFLNCATLEFIAIGKSLENLHESRKFADYDLRRAFSDDQRNALVCVERAEAIRTGLLAIVTSANEALLRREMEAYRARVNLT